MKPAAPPWRLLIEPAACGEGYAALLYPPHAAAPIYGAWAATPVLGQVDCSGWLRRHLHLPPTAELPIALEEKECS